MICSGLAWPALICAQDNAIEAAKHALRNTQPPWYDAESDELHNLTVVTEEKERTRGNWRGSQRARWNWNWDGGSWSWLGELIKLLAWCVLTALLGLLMYALVQTHLNPIRTGKIVVASTGDELLTDEQRIENLPVQLQRTKGDFLSVARYHYQAGNFGDAMVYLFIYRLLQLDKVGFIRLTKGKTNRQYLAELQNSEDLRTILAQTMRPFEDFFFGQHELTRERFEQCWNRNDQFQMLIQ